VVIDDDEEMGVAMSRQTEEHMWPALPGVYTWSVSFEVRRERG